MNKHVFEITDIFRGAFFLCNGGDLAGIRMDGNGKRIATFLIQGEGLHRLDREYRNGQALVDPLKFRESLNHLRDILFNKLRDPASGPSPYAVTRECPAMRKRYAEASGGTRYDRKRRDRSYQREH
jgi:hypothetical protein